MKRSDLNPYYKPLYNKNGEKSNLFTLYPPFQKDVCLHVSDDECPRSDFAFFCTPLL